MASYSVAKSKTATLTASTADDVTLTGLHTRIEVVNHDTTNTVSCTLNGATATDGGDDTEVVLPGERLVIYDRHGEASAIPDDTDSVVSIIGESTSTPTYTVVAR